MNVPKIEPIKVTEYTSKQSRFSHCGKLPIRSIVLGPSGSGKTVLLTNLILDVYKGCFNRIYVWSPSIDLDATWRPVKKYVEDNGLYGKDEKCFFDQYVPEELEHVIDTQRKVTQIQKDKGKKKLYQILLVIDDWADDPSFSRNSKLLHSLYTRGRHSLISVITATQKFNALSPIIRINATELMIYRLRNQKDLDIFLEEVSALFDRKTLLAIYQYATNEPYSFLYVKLTAPTKDEMFYLKLSKKLSVENIKE